MGKDGAYLDDLLYCLIIQKGFKGENIKFKINCNCRKPKTGLYDLAKKKHNIDFKQSWVIGDRTADSKRQRILVQGHNVKTGFSGKDSQNISKPIYYAEDCLDAVNFILKEDQKMNFFLKKIEIL